LTIEVWTVDVSALTRIRQVCARKKLFFEQRWGHISTNKFALIWVVRGDQELPSVITRGVIWHYSRVYDVDYAEA
jgi:hypothetical protein